MKIVSTLAAAAVACGALSGCGHAVDQQVDDVDYAQYCADHLTNTVAAPQMCDSGDPRYQIGYSDVGHHVWGSNGYDSTPDYVFVPVGRPLPVVTYVRPYNYSYRPPLVYSVRPVHRAVSVPYKQYVKTAPKVPASPPKAATTAPAAKPPNPGIQRGGLGVPSTPKAAPPAPTFSPRPSGSSKVGKK